MRTKWIPACAGLVVALALAMPSAAVAAAPAVTVIGQENAILAKFTTAKCTKGKPRGGKISFTAEATSTNGQYELVAAIVLAFTGFHKYDLSLEPDPNPYLHFGAKSERAVFGSGYSNEFVPPYPVPGFGRFTFTPNGKRMGIGFGPAMFNKDASDAVVLAGGLECRYKGKR
jgi:hypothetical protein